MTDRAAEFVRHIETMPSLTGFTIVVVRSLHRDAIGVLIKDEGNTFAKLVVSGRELLNSRDLRGLAQIKVDEAIMAVPVVQRAIDVD